MVDPAFSDANDDFQSGPDALAAAAADFRDALLAAASELRRRLDIVSAAQAETPTGRGSMSPFASGSSAAIEGTAGTSAPSGEASRLDQERNRLLRESTKELARIRESLELATPVRFES